MLETSVRPPEPVAVTGSPPLSCVRSDERGAIRLTLAGELDVATLPRLDAALTRAQSEAALVIVDLRALQFIACDGLRLLVEAGRRARRMRGRLVVVRGPAQVERLFELIGLELELELELVDRPPGRLPLPRTWAAA